MANDNPNIEQSNSQVERIYRYLLAGNSLTGLEALRLFSTMYLPRRSCGIEISGNYPFCSMCYGDIAYGDDGYYEREMQRQDEQAQQRREEEMQQEEDN